MPGGGNGKCKGPEVSGESGISKCKALRSWAPQKDSRSYSECSGGCGRVLSKRRVLAQVSKAPLAAGGVYVGER